MKNNLFMKLVVLIFISTISGNVSAQGFLKKIGKTVKKVASSFVTTDTSTSSESATEQQELSINWDAIPQYTVKTVKVTDSKGNTVLNADGTAKIQYLLTDQFGNVRSKEVVEAQHAKLKKLTNSILGNVTTGTLVGGIGALLNGKDLKSVAVSAAGGAFVGILVSSSDINSANKLKNSMKQQEKLLEAYEKTFTSEGELADASVDVSKIADLDLKDDNTVSMSATEIAALTSDPNFKNADDSSWDLSGLL